MKLLSGDLSPYSAKVRMQIYAKGITDIPLERPATFGTADFRKVSALARIPILDLGGDQIPESEVIAEYLEENPDADEAEAYEVTADAAYYRMRDYLADYTDRLRQMQKEVRP